MRYLTLAAALAGLVFAMSSAHADNYYGPRQNGNQCYVHQVGEFGYWAPCKSGHGAQAARSTNSNAKIAAKKR
ncbi:MAG TPA: hypothetical protein VH684_17330 [Xanthobacteraceae bacterium]